jgi:ribosomal RNA-processing protein 9
MRSSRAGSSRTAGGRRGGKRPVAGGRGRGGFSAPGGGSRKRSAADALERRWADEDVSSGEEDEGIEQEQVTGKPGEDDEDLLETAEQRRVRLSQAYLSRLKKEEYDEDDDGEEDDSEDEEDGVDRIGARLERDRRKAQGILHRDVANQLKGMTLTPEFWHGHKFTVTSVALSNDDRTAVSGSKDNSVVLWDVQAGKMSAILKERWSKHSCGGIPSHKGEVLTVAVSSDGRFVAAGGRDKLVRVWDARVGASSATEFTGHRDAISSLAFRIDSHDLFSGSHDRCIKHWDLDQMGYVETLFGHQAEITAIDCGRKERVLSCGRDATVRIWKVPEETHLVFRPTQSLIGGQDCCAFIDDEWFLSGGDAGALSMWFHIKKKPAAVAEAVHGIAAGGANWISSVAALRASDLAASGSCDGKLRLWQCDTSNKILKEVAHAPVPGFVNDLKFASSGRFMLAGVGTEHRLGRWMKVKGGKNGICMIPLLPAEELLESNTADD